jgi:hypothetical protein
MTDYAELDFYLGLGIVCLTGLWTWFFKPAFQFVIDYRKKQLRAFFFGGPKPSLELEQFS